MRIMREIKMVDVSLAENDVASLPASIAIPPPPRELKDAKALYKDNY